MPAVCVGSRSAFWRAYPLNPTARIHFPGPADSVSTMPVRTSARRRAGSSGKAGGTRPRLRKIRSSDDASLRASGCVPPLRSHSTARALPCSGTGGTTRCASADTVWRRPRETPPSVVAFDARRAGAVALQHGGDERFGRFHAERRIKYVRYVNGVVCPCFVADRAQVVLSRVRRIGVVPLFYRPFGQFVVGGETVSVEHALGRRGISLIHRFE